MTRRLFRLMIALPTGLLAGCGAHLASQPVLPPLPVQAASPPPAGYELPITADSTASVIGAAWRDFEAGEEAFRDGRLVAARQAFDMAVDRMLAVPGGARSTPRLASEFDRLLDRISAFDLQALRDGDGFAESRSEPAAIDELLEAGIFERPQPAETTRDTVLADLRRHDFDLDIPPHERVMSYVELFQGRLRDFMADGLQRSLRYLPMIREVFSEAGVPADLAYVPLVESGFKVTALSRASARGIWQFMPSTGRAHGLEQTWFIDERADPERATRAAAEYLKTLNATFDGDWNLTLAAYNAGPGRVQRAIRRARTTDYWKLRADRRYLPRETREYVPMVMAATIVARSPELYGFDVGSASPLAYERVTVPGALDLKILAEWIGVPPDDLRELNPELRRTTTPFGEHDLKVPLGTAPTLTAKLATADPSLFVQFDFYTVERGDTLWEISRRYGLSLSELRLANNLSTRAILRVNQTLTIPHRTASGLPAQSARSTSGAASTAVGPTTYQVRAGDTLLKIARRFGTTVSLIKQLNQLSGDRIRIGDRLTVR